MGTRSSTGWANSSWVKSFLVDPYGGGVVGSIMETYDKKQTHNSIQYFGMVVRLHMLTVTIKFSWVNGGLALCKSKFQAVRDIKMGLNEFFPDITDIKKLGALYGKVQRFEGLIIPRVEKWESYANCGTRIFCAIYETSDKKPFIPCPTINLSGSILGILSFTKSLVRYGKAKGNDQFCNRSFNGGRIPLFALILFGLFFLL